MFQFARSYYAPTGASIHLCLLINNHIPPPGASLLTWTHFNIQYFSAYNNIQRPDRRKNACPGTTRIQFHPPTATARLYRVVTHNFRFHPPHNRDARQCISTRHQINVFDYIRQHMCCLYRSLRSSDSPLFRLIPHLQTLNPAARFTASGPKRSRIRSMAW